MASMRGWVRRRASSLVATPSKRMTNSSPPKRASRWGWPLATRTECWPSTRVSRRPTARSSWSPAACPMVSLTALKRSRSTKMTAIPELWPSTQACSTSSRRSSIRARLGRPVTRSTYASVLMRSRFSSSSLKLTWDRRRKRARCPRSCGLNGLEMKSSAPMLNARSTEATSSCPVMMSTGMSLVRGLARIRVHVSKPSMPDIWTSRTTISGGRMRDASSAASPELAHRTLQPAASKAARTTSQM